MSSIVVGISDLAVSSNPADVIKTFSLGSCIGVCMYDPILHIGGLLHFMLPLSSTSPDKAKTKPAMFADTGLALLFGELRKKGAVSNRLQVKLAGGAHMLDQKLHFNIGERNMIAVRKILWKNNILIKASHVGGNIPRTMWIEIATGKVVVKHSRGEELL